jgi:hypothetical protein
MVIPKDTPKPAEKAANPRASATILEISPMTGKKRGALAAKADQATAKSKK